MSFQHEGTLTIRESDLQCHVGFLLYGTPFQKARRVHPAHVGLYVGTLQSLVLAQLFVSIKSNIRNKPENKV